MKLLLFFALTTVASCQEIRSLGGRNPVKRSYVCPPKFIRQGHRCYFYSKDAVTWQEAMFRCRKMHSNLAVVQHKNQDKLIRNLLGKKSLDPLERWLGAVYDWRNATWKWAASGKTLAFDGFPKESPKGDPDVLKWQCIVVDPERQYMWNSRSCIEPKHFICQTRLKTVTNRDKKKLKRQYNVNKDNRLNEIPVPSIPESADAVRSLKHDVPITYRFEINEELSDDAMFAYRSPEMHTKRNKGNGRNRKRNPHRFRKVRPIAERPNPRRSYRKGENEKDPGKPTSIKNIRWKTYRKEEKLPNPLYPQPIVEEYNYVRDGR